MSDLVERVGKAIRSKTDFDSDEIARAAIKAVAEWLDPKKMPSLLANTPSEIISVRLRNELEGGE